MLGHSCIAGQADARAEWHCIRGHMQHRLPAGWRLLGGVITSRPMQQQRMGQVWGRHTSAGSHMQRGTR